jgi:membrane peptidoglycan carboxypeptidase
VPGLASEVATHEVTCESGGFSGPLNPPSGQAALPLTAVSEPQRGRVSSKADDFGLRYRDVRNGDPAGNGATGGYATGGYGNGGYGLPEGPGNTVDYDLGYDAQGWDTQGFRRPQAGYPEAGPAASEGNGRTGSQARAAGVRDAGAPTWGAGMPGRTHAWVPGGPAGPGGSGPRGPGWKAPKVKGSWWRHWTPLKVLGVLLGIIGAFVVLAAIAVAVAYEETPVPTEAMAATDYSQTLVYAGDGKTLIGRFGTTDRQMLALDQIPANLVNAVLAAEDRHFWTEGGISLPSTLRAAFEDLNGNDGSLQGGSTITQQFVRNYYQGIGTQQTLSRKIKEIFVAMKVAKEKSKTWILENYLNTIFLGEGSYGVEAAAETYFGKPVGQLSVAQDAVIAALIQQPSTYPLPQYHAQLVARWRYVLSGMVQMGNLSAQEAATMKFPKPGDNIPQSFGKDVWDPYVMYMVRNELEQVYHLTWSQIYDGGYTITTTIDPAKMTQLYQAVIQNEATIDNSAFPFESYMHVGAVLENPANGAIEALYPGPGFPGSKYNGIGPVITVRECKKIACEVNMAVYNREQVGSSFKPYILATAVKQGMNVKSSTLYGFDYSCIPLDTQPTQYPVVEPSKSQCPPGWYWVSNDSAAENGPFTPQLAMAESINTAYTDLWHVVAGPHGANVVNVAQAFGVNTDAAGITGGSNPMEDEAGIALGQASLTVGEQATMLATIDDNGVYHDAHVIASITRNGVPTPVVISSDQVFNPLPQLNAEEDSQVQYAMSEDTASYGTAPVAALSNGQEVIAKTGTTNDAQSAFFIGAIPTQALAVAIFTSNQSGNCPPAAAVCQSLNNLGGSSQGGYGGTWPATIWHTYAENMFVPLGVEQFQPVTFTGGTWNLVPPNLRKHPKKHHNNPGQNQNGQNPNGQPTPNQGGPYPTYSCNPHQVTCSTGTPGQNSGGGQGDAPTVSGAAAGAAAGGGFAALPVTCLWVRRRTRKRGARRG